MGKSSRQIKAAQRGNTSAIEHIETTDDSFLPEAAELAKYKEVDPECICFCYYYEWNGVFFFFDLFRTKNTGDSFRRYYDSYCCSCFFEV